MPRVMDAWEAARVVRKHTMINIRAENVAEHTWGVDHILFCIWPGIPFRVVIGAHYHDGGEYATGDVPANVKWANPGVAETCSTLETTGIRNTLPEHLHECLDLSDLEKKIIEIADRTEFCFSTYYEIMMGNRHVVKMFRRSLDRVFLLAKEIEQEVREYIGTNVAERITALTLELMDLETRIGESI